VEQVELINGQPLRQDIIPHCNQISIIWGAGILINQAVAGQSGRMPILPVHGCVWSPVSIPIRHSPKRWKQQFADGGAVVIAVDTNVLIRILVDEHCAALQMQSACALLAKSEVLFASERSGGNGIGKSR